jgi:hypothetical protein
MLKINNKFCILRGTEKGYKYLLTIVSPPMVRFSLKQSHCEDVEVSAKRK